jgi:putative PEP-CTERM system TPR-repeat lipoprotein
MLDLDAGRVAEALTRAKELQKSHPKDVAGYVIAGDVHATQKAWGEAVTAYRGGLKLAENSTDLAQRVYAALSAGNQTSESARFAESWLKAHPKDLKFRGFLAEAANSRKDYATAATHYRALLAEQPKNPALLNNLAWALGQLRDPKALSYAEEANKLVPNQPALMDTLGTLLVEKGDVERGLELQRKAVELAPQAAEVRLNLAKSLIKANKKPEAKKELETLAQLGDKFAAQAEVGKLLQGL